MTLLIGLVYVLVTLGLLRRRIGWIGITALAGAFGALAFAVYL